MSRPAYRPQASSSAIIPTSHPPPPPPPQQRATTLRRGKTLTRPERGVAQAPLITPPAPLPPSTKSPFPHIATPAAAATGSGASFDWWVAFSLVVTFWAPPPVLQACGFKDSPTRQAWREKISLVFICVVLGAIVAFLTMALDKVLCPESASLSPGRLRSLGKSTGVVGVAGWAFNITTSQTTASVDFYNISRALSGQDTTNLFTRRVADYPLCTGIAARYASTPPCSTTAGSTDGLACPLGELNATTYRRLSIVNETAQIGYSWEDVSGLSSFFVLDGQVVNLFSYLSANPRALASDPVDRAIRTALANPSGGKDATKLFYGQQALKDAVPCIQQRYYAGQIDKVTPGCFISNIFLYVALGVILGVILIRFVMACIFSWFISARMILPPKDLKSNAISPMVLPGNANLSVDAPDGTAPWRGATIKRPTRGPGGASKAAAAQVAVAPLVTQAQIGAELFTVCLITCYSESLESIKGTCDSIASTGYADNRKLLFIVADGMVTGDGETISTPDICVGLIEADERFGNPMPMGYVAIGSGRKRENRAMVYAGHYLVGSGRDAHRVPAVVVVKCGMPAEATDKKPGNRGKRDSQLILMNFFSRVTYNDRMTPLDFDLFRKIQVLMGVTPDFFEVCLMVDADTVVFPDSMKHLVNVMNHDRYVMGVCGETRVANKRQSWVTAIQVFEYFISHHQSKAFESVFGGVTCLPGCFSMYRLKARKLGDDDWVPIITLPDIVREYSQSEVSTLHQKNLLLLGEDRFLSTLMLRTFPNRKMMFCPQARCRTVVPDTFSILLSQRRRWINSTVHNLMELIRVRNLCGTFCFSMQFVVFMDLIGTVTLPVAICLTLALIINSIITPPSDFTSAIPLLLLAAVLFLPAFLILITTGKFIYVAWMFAYLCALPVWNFILPAYSFWHFDDFSWGETRKVVGDLKGAAHEDDKSELVTTVPLRRWEDWERSRLRRIKREERRKKDLERMERAFRAGAEGGFDSNGSLFAPRSDGTLTPRGGASEYGESDTMSMFSSEDDQWGQQIGAYNENAPQFPPPPLVFEPILESDGEEIDANDLHAMLDAGYDDNPRSPFSHPNGTPSQQSLMQTYQSSSPLSAPRPLAGGPANIPRFALNDDGPPPPQQYYSNSRAAPPPLAPAMRQYPSARSPLEGSTMTLTYQPLSPSTPNSADSQSSATGYDRRPEQSGGGKGGAEGHTRKRSLGSGGASAGGTRKEPYGPGGPLMSSSGGGGGPPPLMLPPAEHHKIARS